MRKTICLTLVLLISTIGIPGCNDCNCPKEKYADVDGVNSSVVRKPTATSGLSTVKAGDKIRWDEVAYFLSSYTIRTYANKDWGNSTYHWGTAAYACDCDPPGILGTQEKLKYITVRTAFNFTSAHPAGSIINELAALIVYPNTTTTPLNEYLSKGLIPYKERSSFQLVVTQAPTIKGPFALDITVELDNGEVYTTRTPVIELI